MEKNAPYISRLVGLKRIKSRGRCEETMSIEKHSEAEGHGGHNNSSGSQHKESGGLAPCKEYWRSRGDEWERSSWSHFRTRNRSCIFSLWRDGRVDASEGNHATRFHRRVSGRECQSRDEPDDAPSRAPHTGTTRRRASRYRQHRRCSQASAGGSGAWDERPT